MVNITTFSIEKEKFDKEYSNKNYFIANIPVNLTLNKKCIIKSKNNERNEEYYKWQFISSLINSGLYCKDFIGVEICLPKGNKNSSPIKFDAAIFKSKNWFSHYKNFHKTNDQDELEWIRKDIISAIKASHKRNRELLWYWNVI